MIVAHGEQNGRLDSELLYYSQFCLQKLEDKTMKLFYDYPANYFCAYWA